MGYMSAVLRTAQSRNAPDTSFMPSLCWRTQLRTRTKTRHFKKTEELKTLLWIIFQEETLNNPDSQDSDYHWFNTCETLKALPATFKNHQTSSMPPRIFRKIQWKGKIWIISSFFSYLTLLEKVETKHKMSKLLWGKSLNIIFTERLSFLYAVQLEHSNLFLPKEFELDVKNLILFLQLEPGCCPRLTGSVSCPRCRGWSARTRSRASPSTRGSSSARWAVIGRHIWQLISDWSSASSGSSPRSPSSPARTCSWCGCWRATSMGARYLQIFFVDTLGIYLHI